MKLCHHSEALPAGTRTRCRGFTLIEVAVASAILAIALFSILQICTVCLRGARSLSRVHVDASSLAAELSLTNRIEEGSDSGTFGDAYPGYSWTRTIGEFATNGLYQVDFQVVGSTREGALDHSEMSILLFRPDAVRRAGR
jgi:prepilin-type N-terminal cleavage/methylation domain-containing protein